MDKLIKILHNGNCSYVVKNYDQIFTFSQRDVADLYDMIKTSMVFSKGQLLLIEMRSRKN